MRTVRQHPLYGSDDPGFVHEVKFIEAERGPAHAYVYTMCDLKLVCGLKRPPPQCDVITCVRCLANPKGEGVPF